MGTPRIRLRSRTASRGACLIVAVFAVVGAARTLAQTALPQPDPFAPQLEDWLRSNISGVDYTASTFLFGLRFQR